MKYKPVGCLNLKGKPLLLVTTLLTSLGFCLIGYDNGLMGGLIDYPPFQRTFGYPSSTLVGTIVAIYEIGCFVGAIITSIFGEYLGRRKTIAYGAIVMAIGAIIQSSSYSVAQIIVGRIVSGIGMGAINSTVPVLQAEVSPKATRGIYVCAQLSTLNFGILLAYWLDFGLSYVDSPFSFRFPIAFQLVFIIPIFFLTFVVPESPRWLASHDMDSDVISVVSALSGKPNDHTDVLYTVDEIKGAVHMERSLGSGSWKDLLQSDSLQSRRRLWTACAIQAFQQLGGINAIIYYAATLFHTSIGFSSRLSGIMSGVLSTWMFIASFIPWFLIDRIGRIPLFLSMISLMAVVMAVQAALVYQVENNTSVAHAAGIAAAVMLFVFEGAFTIGFQATVWVYPSEVLPLSLRAKGSAISTAANWICNYIIVQITPPALKNIGYRTYIIFAVLNFTWVPIIALYFKETKGLSLEEVDSLFSRYYSNYDDNASHIANQGSNKNNFFSRITSKFFKGTPPQNVKDGNDSNKPSLEFQDDENPNEDDDSDSEVVIEVGKKSNASSVNSLK